MGWRDVQAGVASGAIDYRKKSDKFGSFLEGFASVYAPAMQRKAEKKDAAETLEAKELKAQKKAEEVERKARLTEARKVAEAEEKQQKQYKKSAKAVLSTININATDQGYSRAFNKAFSMLDGGRTVEGTIEFFAEQLKTGAMVTNAPEVQGPMTPVQSRDAFDPLVQREAGAGGLDALLNQSQNSQFASTKVSEMTLGEVLEFQLERGGASYHAYSKDNMPAGTEASKLGLGSTPVGKYQFVGDTMKDMQKRAFKTLKFDENTIFNEETQDALFVWLAKDKMTGASTQEEKRAALRGGWEGIRDKTAVSDAQVDEMIEGIETGTFSSDGIERTDDLIGRDGKILEIGSPVLNEGQTVTFVKREQTKAPGPLGSGEAGEYKIIQRIQGTIDAEGHIIFPSGKKSFNNYSEISEVSAAYKDDGYQEVFLSDKAGNPIQTDQVEAQRPESMEGGIFFNDPKQVFDEVDISGIATMAEYNSLDANLRANPKNLSPEFKAEWATLKSSISAVETTNSIEEMLPISFLTADDTTAAMLTTRIALAQSKLGTDVELPAYIQEAKTIIEGKLEYTQQELIEMTPRQLGFISQFSPSLETKNLAAKLLAADPDRYPDAIELSGFTAEKLKGLIATIFDEDDSEPGLGGQKPMDDATQKLLKTAQAILATKDQVNLSTYLAGMGSIATATNRRLEIDNNSDLNKADKEKLLGIIDTHILDLESLSTNLGLSKAVYSGTVTIDKDPVTLELILRDNGQFYSPILNRSFSAADLQEDPVNQDGLGNIIADAARFEESTFAKMKKHRADNIVLIRRAKRLDETVEANPAVLNFIGGKASSILDRLGVELGQLKSFLGATSDEDRRQAVLEFAQEDFASDEVQEFMTKAGVNAEAFANYYSQVTEFAFSYARGALGQTRTTDQDFNKALEIVRAGSTYGVFSNSLRGLVKTSVKNSEQAHDEYLDGPAFRAASSRLGAAPFYEGIDKKLEPYLQEKGLGAAIEWYNSTAATVTKAASTASAGGDSLEVLENFSNNIIMPGGNAKQTKKSLALVIRQLQDNTESPAEEIAASIQEAVAAWAADMNVSVNDLQKIMGLE